MILKFPRDPGGSGYLSPGNNLTKRWNLALDHALFLNDVLKRSAAA